MLHGDGVSHGALLTFRSDYAHFAQGLHGLGERFKARGIDAVIVTDQNKRPLRHQ